MVYGNVYGAAVSCANPDCIATTIATTPVGLFVHVIDALLGNTSGDGPISRLIRTSLVQTGFAHELFPCLVFALALPDAIYGNLTTRTCLLILPVFLQYYRLGQQMIKQALTRTASMVVVKIFSVYIGEI